MQLTPTQIALLKEHWNFEGEFRFHRRLANIVYFARIDGREVVLRLTELSHRQADELRSELDWMSYLTRGGLKIAAPIPSKSGTLTEEIVAEETLHAAVFEKAPGVPLDDEPARDPDMLRTWGRYLGKMNRLTRAYVPAPGVKPRQQWRADENLKMALSTADPVDGAPYQRLHELIEWQATLPKSEDVYGLVHADLHRGNFFVENGEITAFDFDDCVYQWFAYDIVTPVHNINTKLVEGERDAETARYQALFLEGYARENTLDPLWVRRLPIFELYRAAQMFHWIKLFSRNGVFNGKQLEWAKIRTPRLLEILKRPIDFF